MQTIPFALEAVAVQLMVFLLALRVTEMDTMFKGVWEGIMTEMDNTDSITNINLKWDIIPAHTVLVMTLSTRTAVDNPYGQINVDRQTFAHKLTWPFSLDEHVSKDVI